MDKDTRNAIERATQRARKLLEADFAEQLEGTYDVLLSGNGAASGGPHLTARQRLLREKIVAALEHKRAGGMTAAEAVADYRRDAAFTALNRFVALKMLEARELVQECISQGDQSSGYREFCGLAPGVALLPEGEGYRLYLECIFDELSTEVKVLFDRRDVASALWPRRPTLEKLLEVLNGSELAAVWSEDETIGWVYQYFNAPEERRAMRDASQAPRNSRELAVRNQFFTPRYVVQFLTDNTLGRIWYEMREGQTGLVGSCEYMVRRPEEQYQPRVKKDPRDLRILDPACGSGHFLLYAFDLLLVIYREGWADAGAPRSEVTGRTLREDFASLETLQRELPGLILRHNLHGVDIDPRCAQIAQLALWMRAQRTLRDFGIARAKRPLIRRANIIIAEPMPGEADLRAEFLSRLADPELAVHFEELVERMKLAGELGLLLRVEELVQSTTRKGVTGNLFAPPAERIRSALARFAEDAVATQQARRRMFLDDAVQGLGLVELGEGRFDIVLMNPPFGEAAQQSEGLLGTEDCGNLYSAFVRRAIELGATAIGCISDRTFLVQSTFQRFRCQILEGDVALQLLGDLGWGVLDANVQTVAYVLRHRSDDHCAFGDARGSDYKPAALKAHSGLWKWGRTSSFVRLPSSVIAYSLPATVLAKAREWSSLSDLALLPRGLGSNKATRTYLAWVEVAEGTLGRGRRWEALANGGEFAPFWRQDLGVADWRTPDGKLWVEMSSSDRRPYDQAGVEGYFSPGLSFPKQSSSFNVAVLPEGFLPTREGKAIIPKNVDDIWLILSYLNSGPVRAFVRDTCGLHKQSGSVARIPFPPFNSKDREELVKIGARLADLVRNSFTFDETSRFFIAPARACDRLEWGSERAAEVERLIAQIDNICGALFELGPEDSGWTEQAARPIFYEARSTDLISWAFGLAFGRFVHCRPENVQLGPLLDFSWCRSPAMADAESSEGVGLAVDDAGHRDDIVARLMAKLATPSVMSEVSPEDLSATNIRAQLRSEFFRQHVERYAIARRKCPIYWQLATPSASYSVWLYIHAFTRDTLYKIQNEYVAPKLAYEERKLDSLRGSLGPNAKASERKEIEAQESLVGELRAFLDEVKRVAPLWNPNLDDGVIINFAPLWRMVSHHKPWQKELKATWDALCTGDYDWAHLAMHLWPERVVPKCASDRSLAIAHGVEDVLWVEGQDGKWKPRPTPARPVEELVRERTSPAVKTALKSLLEAPVVASGGGRGRPVRKRKDSGGAA